MGRNTARVLNNRFPGRWCGRCRVSVCSIFLLAMLPLSAIARIDITPMAVTQVLNWNGGDLVAVQDFCVVSTSGAQPQSTNVLPYRVEVAAPFALLSGANQIAGSLQWQDLRTTAITQLAPDTPTAYDKTGDITNCPGGNNGRLIATFPSAAIIAAPPGDYQGDFVITVSNTGGGRNSFASTLTLTLNLPDTVRISNLNDIDLGSYTGADLTAADSLCVYRASGLSYAVTATGSGPGGSFTLTDGAGSQVPFSASWNDGAGAVVLAPGVLLSGRTNSMAGSDTCNFGANNNAVLSVLVSAADLQLAPAGSHSGVITLTVELE